MNEGQLNVNLEDLMAFGRLGNGEKICFWG